MGFLDSLKSCFSPKIIDTPPKTTTATPPAPIETSTEAPVTTITPPTPVADGTAPLTDIEREATLAPPSSSIPPTAAAPLPTATPTSTDSTAPDAQSYAAIAATPAFDPKEVTVVFVLGGPGAGKS